MIKYNGHDYLTKKDFEPVILEKKWFINTTYYKIKN